MSSHLYGFYARRVDSHIFSEYEGQYDAESSGG